MALFKEKDKVYVEGRGQMKHVILEVKTCTEGQIQEYLVNDVELQSDAFYFRESFLTAIVTPRQHEPGAKLDHGKPRVALVLQGFNLALLRVADVGTAGALKYSDNGWKSVESGYKRYSDAMMRHWLQEPEEDMDVELQIEHQACVAWNALARLNLLLQVKKEDELLDIPAFLKRQSD